MQTYTQTNKQTDMLIIILWCV